MTRNSQISRPAETDPYAASLRGLATAVAHLLYLILFFNTALNLKIFRRVQNNSDKMLLQEYQLVESWGLEEAQLAKCNVNAIKVGAWSLARHYCCPILKYNENSLSGLVLARGGEGGDGQEGVRCFWS